MQSSAKKTTKFTNSAAGEGSEAAQPADQEGKSQKSATSHSNTIEEEKAGSNQNSQQALKQSNS